LIPVRVNLQPILQVLRLFSWEKFQQFGPNLADFLNGEADIEALWRNFDTDGNGYIDVREFDNLLYMVLAVWIASNSEDDISIPSPKDLQVQIKNLEPKQKFEIIFLFTF